MKKIDEREMFRLIQERVPEDFRMRSVYIPMIGTDVALFLCDSLLDELARMRMDNTKKPSRNIREMKREYRRKIHDGVKSLSAERHFLETSMEYYDSIATDMQLFNLQCMQELLNMRVRDYDRIVNAACLAYVIKKILGNVIEIDREFGDEISRMLGEGVVYTTMDNEECVAIMRAIDSLLEAIGLPADISNGNIDLAVRIFRNKLTSVRID